MKNLLLALLPQIILDLIIFGIRPLSGFLGRYSSFESAKAKSAGYEDDSVVDFYAAEFERLQGSTPKPRLSTPVSDRRMRILGALGVASESKTSSITDIVDFGGGVGQLYADLAPLLPNLQSWRVVETPAVVKQILSIQEGKQPIVLEFSDELTSGPESSDQGRVLVASGVIQCVPNPSELLAAFRLEAEFVILDRTPVIPGLAESFVSVQRRTRLFSGTRGSYPAWFFSQDQFEAELQRDFEILMTWSVPEDRPFVGFKRHPYRGYLLAAKGSRES
jgi:putative methyltransferase (TIGR04325 family)